MIDAIDDRDRAKRVSEVRQAMNCMYLGRKDIMFTVPLPESLNVYLRTHWAKRAREQKRYDDIVKLKIRRYFEARIPQFPTAKIKYTIITNRLRDWDNNIVILKILNDSIVKSGLIPDDNQTIIGKCELGFICNNKIKNKEKEVRVEIKLPDFEPKKRLKKVLL